MNLACIRPENTLPPQPPTGGGFGPPPGVPPPPLPSGPQPGGYHVGPPASTGGGGGGGGSSTGTTGDITLRKLFVRGLNYETPSEVLQEVIGQYGQVSAVLDQSSFT